jgi:predicted dehydrogenase
LLDVALTFPEVEVTAVCDIDARKAESAGQRAVKAGGHRPGLFTSGPKDYLNLLGRDDVDAVVIATPMSAHGVMSADALRAGKHVLSEVAAAMTLDECWNLVRSSETSNRIYMLAENCCYYRQNLVVSEMIRFGLFGPLTFAECGYVHDCRSYIFAKDGSLTWRGEMARDHIGNLYPTHALGPVCQWLGINRGDRLVSLTATSTQSVGLTNYASKVSNLGKPEADVKFKLGDSTSTIIRTAKGAVIDLRYDTVSARPHPSTTYFTLQGLRASYKDDGTTQNIWVESQSKDYSWEPLSGYQERYDHRLWKKSAQEAAKTSHGGADYFVVAEFLDCLRTGRHPPINAYDAAAWSSIIPLSAESILSGGEPKSIPDFTRGGWKEA